MSEVRSIAEIEKDNARLARLRVSSKMAQDRYNNTILDDEGVLLDTETAIAMLSAVAPEHIAVECSRYYFVNDRHSAVIVGVNVENEGLFTAELPREMADVADDPFNLQESVKYYQEQEKMFREVRLRGNLVLLAGVVLIAAIAAVNTVYGAVPAAALLLAGSLCMWPVIRRC